MNERVGLTAEQLRLRDEFNQWAARGKGEAMARHHGAIAEKMFARMGLAAGDRVLDLGCGSGWATRLAAAPVGPRGLAVGVDVSDAMIRTAMENPEPLRNVRYLSAPAENIPWSNDFFSHIFSIESFYYYPDSRAVLEELRRVLAPRGRLFLLMCLYTGNPNAAQWQEKLAVPVHLRSPEQWRTLLSEAGWSDIASEEFTPPAGSDDEHAWALLVTARKP
jgi:ubiquinone/menaquinone biosynthesis C-methylase UbiE